MTARDVLATNQFYYQLPTLIALAVLGVAFVLRRSSLLSVSFGVLMVAIAAGELRFPFGGKTLLLAAHEVVLGLLISVLLVIRFDRVVVGPRRVVVCFTGLLGVMMLATYASGVGDNALRSLRGLVWLGEEAAVMSVVLSFLRDRERLRECLEWWWLAPLVILAEGLLVTADSYGWDPSDWAAHRLFTTPIGLNNTTAGVATLYFVVVGMMTVVRPRAREVLGAAAALTVVVLANSRNGIVTAALGFVLMLFLSGMGVAKRIGVAATTVAALVIAVTQEWLTPQFSRLALVGAVSGVDDTWGGRFVAWAFSLELATERPLLGWGLHTIDGSRITETDVFFPHNVFLQELVSGGVVALGVRTILLGFITAAAIRILRTAVTAEERAVALGVLCSVFFAQWEPFFYTNCLGFFFAVLAGLCIRISSLSVRQGQTPVQTS